MMDNLRRNVDDLYYTKTNTNYDGDLVEGIRREVGQNKLDTVTTVPQLQQKFNKFNIIEEEEIAAAAATTTTTNTKTLETSSTTTTTTCVAAATLTTTSSSSLIHTSLTQQQNTALAKFNRIIDNTVPVINNYQQHVAETLAKGLHQHQQHPQHQQLIEMPALSDSLKRRLASHQQQQQHYTELIVNNSKINFSSVTTSEPEAVTASTSAAAFALLSSQQRKQQRHIQETSFHCPTNEDNVTKSVFDVAADVAEDNLMKRNDVHYLLKQLNSFSDIEEIEIVDMKQKQRQQQKQQQQYNKEKTYENQMAKQQHTKMNLTHCKHVERSQQYVELAQPHDAQYALSAAQHVEVNQQHVTDALQHIASTPHVYSLAQHVEILPQHVYIASPQIRSDQLWVSLADSQQNVVDLPTYTTTESKQHYEAISPTATSLVIYSPSSQSHKGIRRYASLHQQDEHAAAAAASSHHHHLRHEHYSEGSMLDSAAAQAVAADPQILQQFVDDYIFQSCHYLETNNFAANYRTAMVESSSHEFRPSTTTNTTRTSHEEFDEEETGYVEDHSSARSFELHETEPPTVICKAPAASMRSTLQQNQQKTQHYYAMETRLCSSGVQTDLTASSLAQSFSLSSSLSSSEQRKRAKPLFKCCYTPLDRWREKRSQQTQQQQKRTKTAAAATTTAQQQSISLQKTTSVAVVGGVNQTAGCSSGGFECTTTTTATTTSTAMVVVQPHHHRHHSSTSSRKNSNEPYAV